jgi:hypothetical protein
MQRFLFGLDELHFQSGAHLVKLTHSMTARNRLSIYTVFEVNYNNVQYFVRYYDKYSIYFQ